MFPVVRSTNEFEMDPFLVSLVYMAATYFSWGLIFRETFFLVKSLAHINEFVSKTYFIIIIVQIALGSFDHYSYIR